MSQKDSRPTCEYRPPEEYDSRYDYDSLSKNVLEECYDCGKEIGEKEGCLSDGQRICDRCAYELTVSERPSAYYFDENNEKFDKMVHEHFAEEPHVYKPISRSYCDDPNADEPIDKLMRRFYNDNVVLEPVNCLLPASVDDLYAYLDSQPVSILPSDAVKIDEDFIYCDTFEEAKDILTKATCQPNDATQELSDSYIVSQYSQRYWYVLDQDVRETTKFRISLYVKHDEVATKYLKRKLEECMYCIDYQVNPSDYAHEEPENNWATVEELEEYYREQREEDEDYSNYYTKKALCFTCGEVNYAEPVFETADRTRMVCCDCVEIINCCSECNTVTREIMYDNNLCFDCKFKDEMRWETRQKPLWAHLYTIVDIQRLDKNHFDILADYAELCEFTIFDAYRYKSRCHFYDCDQRIWPHEWDAEQTLQFCCKRHKEYAEDLGCHTQTVYDCTHHGCNFEFEEATCKVCNSYHENNVADRIALRETASGVKPVVSAIAMFKELYVYQWLDMCLFDLIEYI
jgi:hypothetical protein